MKLVHPKIYAAIICSTALVALPQSDSFASETGGEAPMLAEEALAMEASSYAATFGVSEEEAARRLALMHDAGEDIAALKATLGDDLGGLYFDNGADFALVVNTTGKGKPVPDTIHSKGRKFAGLPLTAKGRALGLTDATVRKVRDVASKSQSGKVRKISTARMPKDKVNALRQQNSQKNLEIPGYNGSSYDDQAGEMVVRVFPGSNSAATRKKVEDLYPGIPYRIEEDASKPTDDHTRGGAKIVGSGGCTTGFMVRDRSTNKVGVVTAGHCDSSIVRYTAPDASNYDLTRLQWNMTEKFDLAFFWDDHTPTAEFYPSSSSTPRTQVGWVSVADTTEDSWINSGSYICHYGVYSATQSCGVVTDTSFAPSIYDENGAFQGCGKKSSATKIACGPYFVRVDKREKAGQVALQCIGGDSGGPWFAYGNAYGINKGGYRTTPGDKNTCAYAFYTPIIRINDLNLTMWYGGNVANGVAQ